MRFKFTVYNKNDASKIKELLKKENISYSKKKKHIVNDKVNVNNNEVSKPKKRGRKKLSKDEKDMQKKKRTPEQQKAINEKMAKLRALRKQRAKK